MTNRTLMCSGLVVLLAVGLPAVGRAQMIDDFESADAPAPWTFSNGAEFPGASGSLSAGAGHTGKGAHLAYDFSGGGAYVAMVRSVPNLPAGKTFALWLAADPRVPIRLRLNDEGGQTIQYELDRPFEAVAGGDWCRMMLPPDAPAHDHWGGADDGVLHGGITEIGIVVGSSRYASLSGAVDVDDVELLEASTFVLDPFAAGQALDPATADLFERWGVNIHFTSDDAALDALAEAGFTWIRMDLSWDRVEGEAGVYDFGAYDDLMQALEERGMKAILILDYGNPLYGGGPPTTPAAIQAYGDFAQAAAQHFAGRPVLFEIWNEPDVPSFWPPGDTPLEYAALLAEGIARVHEGDPGALVSTGGLSWFDWDYLDTLLGTGAAEDADFIGVHGYRNGPPESFVNDCISLELMLDEHMTRSPPILNTEWGYSSSSFGDDGTQPAARARQAVWAVRAQLMAWVAGAPVTIWYDVRDDCTDGTWGECNFGLLADDYSEKPVMTAMKALAAVARNRSLTAILSSPAPVQALRLEGDADLVVVAWVSGEGRIVDVPAPTPLSATDIYGAPLDLTPRDGRITLTLEESKGPVYLLYEDHGVIGDEGVDGRTDDVGAGDAGAEVDGADEDDGDAPGGCGCLMI